MFLRKSLKKVASSEAIRYSTALVVVLSQGVELDRGSGHWGQQDHGMADSSLRQGLTRPLQSGLRDSLRSEDPNARGRKYSRLVDFHPGCDVCGLTRWCNWQHMGFWCPYSRFESWPGCFGFNKVLGFLKGLHG